MIDARAPRFGAWVTTAVLAVVLLTGSGLLLLAQAVVFALGATGRPPYGLFFKHVVAPRLAPPTEREDARPPQFAQAVGLLFALSGAVALLAGATTVGLVLTGAALAAAFLNAAFGLCLGCELYLTYRRTVTRNDTRTTTKGVPA